MPRRWAHKQAGNRALLVFTQQSPGLAAQTLTAAAVASCNCFVIGAAVNLSQVLISCIPPSERGQGIACLELGRVDFARKYITYTPQSSPPKCDCTTALISWVFLRCSLLVCFGWPAKGQLKHAANIIWWRQISDPEAASPPDFQPHSPKTWSCCSDWSDCCYMCHFLVGR